jgi:nitrite reductase (NO-forming)
VTSDSNDSRDHKERDREQKGHGEKKPAIPDGVNSFSRARKPGAAVKLPKTRLVLLFLAAVGAIIGLNSALIRASIPAIVSRAPLGDGHGVFMIFGFLGGAIGLERAVAFQAGSPSRPKWGFLAPAFAGVGSLLMIFEALPFVSRETSFAPLRFLANNPQALPGIAWTLSMATLTGIYLGVWRRQQSVAVLIQLLGAFVGVCGIALWARGVDAQIIAPWWMGYLVLTIVGERIELARVAFIAHNIEWLIFFSCVAFSVALGLCLLNPAAGYPALGVSLGAMLLLAITHDTARKTYRLRGVTGFMGTCMLVGYAWALLAAAVWIFSPTGFEGYWRDMAIHALAIGFTMSMVAAHASMIIPSITRRPMTYRPVLWVGWAVMQLGLAVRLLGTTRDATLLWQWGDGISVVGMLAMMVTVAALNISTSSKSNKTAKVMARK